jgi:D-methionine transport system substrate-binding protein
MEQIKELRINRKEVHYMRENRKSWFKKIITITALTTLACVFITGCQAKTTASQNKVITVGASPSPHAEILEKVKEVLAGDGYELKIVEYNDYILPNKSLSTGELDANYFQHKPYLDNYNEENKTNLTSASAIHFEPFGIYAGKTKSLSDLKTGATVIVPNDTTNEARSLLLLEAQGLIKLKSGAGLTATVLDIEANPLNLKIQELEAAQITRSLSNADIACINGNYAIQGGLSVSDAIAVEASDSLAATTYGNIVAVQSGHENDEKIKALVNALRSDTVKEFIESKYHGAVVPLF